eukprot:497378-Rhodomonas_salina.1
MEALAGELEGGLARFKPLPGEAQAHKDTCKGSQVMGTLLYVVCKVLAFSSDCRSVGSIQGSKSSKNFYLRD